MSTRILALLLSLITLASCASGATPTPTSAPQAGSCSLDLGENSGDEEAIRAIIAAEGELVVAQDITLLMALWVDDGFVADAKYTPDEYTDDQRWIGSDAIRHRYVRAVFPGAPTSVQPADLDIAIEDANAVVRATTRIGDEVAPSGDRWELVKTDGCWYLQSLTYNLEQPK